jgi:hypothetical protein
VTEEDDTGRAQIGPRIEKGLTKEVRILAIRQGIRFNALVEEALRDLLEKYRKKAKGK